MTKSDEKHLSNDSPHTYCPGHFTRLSAGGARSSPLEVKGFPFQKGREALGSDRTAGARADPQAAGTGAPLSRGLFWPANHVALCCGSTGGLVTAAAGPERGHCRWNRVLFSTCHQTEITNTEPRPGVGTWKPKMLTARGKETREPNPGHQEGPGGGGTVLG